MKFMDKDFMLHSEIAKELFFDYAQDMPIYDYHCHLNPKEVAENKRFRNITEIWLGGDHYKWRAMRSCGVDEKYITGDSSDFDKFMAWAKIMPYLIGNPLYHWTHLELQRVFGITKTLSEDTAKFIWDETNEQVSDKNFCVYNLFKKFNVHLVGTTDSPLDTLEHHKKYKDSGCDTMMSPSFRPDPCLNIRNEGFKKWVNDLAQISDIEINSYSDLKKALSLRMDYFHENGCRISDLALETPPFEKCADDQAEEIFKKALSGIEINAIEEQMYKTNIVIYLGIQFAKRGWVMQLHMNAFRNNNSKMFNKLGADTGFDSINDGFMAANLSRLLDAMNNQGLLPKTILYSLNPTDNYVLGTMLGNFQSSEAKSKIQFGSGWWFNDQRDGMEEQMRALANLGVLSHFVGMLTDSRSFLSYPRHEYFRRIMCNLIGGWVDKGEYPYDKKMLETIIKGISYNNAKEYFKII